jgi:hypothetical protein
MQLTEQTLNDLASLKDEAGVLSIFVDASPDRQVGEPPALEVSVRQALKKLVEEVHASGPRERWKALTERLDELEPELNRLLSNGESGRGRALFAAIGGGPVRSVQLQVPLREGVVLDEHACLSPLVAALDGTVCVGIVIAQRDAVRAIDVRLGEAEEVERYEFEPAVDYEGRGGKDGRGANVGSLKEEFDQFLTENRHRFLRSVCDRLGPVADQRGWNPIILAGDARLTSQLEAGLKKAGRELMHTDRTPGDYAAPAEVLRTFADDLDDFRVKRELKLVEQARDAALSTGGTGALGLRDTLDALTQARVSHLILEDGRNWAGQHSQDGAILVGSDAPLGLDTSDMIADQNMSERMIERALGTDAKVTLVQGPAIEVLAEYEGVAAILRW